MKRTIAALLTAALLAILLAGCSQSPAEAEATPAPTPTTAPTPAPTATPEPTATPAPTATPEPATFTPGVRTDTTYTNTSLGLHFTATENMVMATDEEMQNMIQGGADVVYGDLENKEQILDQVEQTTGYEMVAADVVTGGGVIIATEKLALEGIDEEQYIDALKQQLSAVNTLQVTFEDPGTVTLGDTAFTGVTYVASANGVQSAQTMLLKKVGDTMCVIILAYSDDTQYQALLSCFSPISAV